MKKKVILILLFISMSACQSGQSDDLYQFKDFTTIKNTLDIVVEYGSLFDSSEIEYQLLKEGLKFEMEVVDTLMVGDKNYRATVDGREYEIRVNVLDTHPPLFEGELNHTITKGDTLNLKEIIKAIDPIDGEVEVTFSNFDNMKIGTHKITATASDKNGNETTTEIVIKVNDKVDVKIPNKPTRPNNIGGGSNTNNSGGSSNTNETSSGNYNTAIAKQMFKIMNEERVNSGLSELVWSDRIHKFANVRAKEITIHFAADHKRPDGSDWYTVGPDLNGENISYGYSNAISAMRGFMSSPGHASNILESRFSSAAVGVYTLNGIHYYVQLFSYEGY